MFKNWFKNKPEEDKPNRSPSTSVSNGEVLDINTYEELPKDLQKAVKDAKLSREDIDNNFELLLNILNFQYKLKFKLLEERKKSTTIDLKQSPPPATLNRRPIQDLESLLSSENPREIYKIIKEEGKGGFGTVFRGETMTEPKKKVAIKIMPHETEKQKKFNESEISFLEFCKHPNIVSYFSSHLVDNDIWCIMEFLEGGTIDLAVKSFNFTEKQIAYVAKGMLQGIKYLHSENLVHRDLKSSNVMLSIRGQIKLIDFGLCVDVSDGMKLSMVGSPFWMPPEMIRRVPHDNKVDIWSFGVCLMELANGHPPNHKSGLRAMFTVGTQGYPNPLEKPKVWSDQFKDFLSKCLQWDPINRPTAAELLEHEFLLKTESEKSMQQVITGIFVLNAILPF